MLVELESTGRGIVRVRHGDSADQRGQSWKDSAGKMDLPGPEVIALVEAEILEGFWWWELDILERRDLG